MKVKNVKDTNVMYQALKNVNKQFSGNIEFRNINRISSNSVQFTLKVKNSKGPGSAFSMQYNGNTRKTGSACWHAHGYFFEELFKLAPDAEITSAVSKITKNEGNWIDKQVGSIMNPCMMSDLCHCE